NTPITISTIHPGANGQFYINNTGNSFSHNGFTVPIPVELEVECGETYHFKYAIADCSDDFLNTAVFIEAGSFVSDAVDVTVATVSGDTTIVEGCTDANFYFTRPENDTADTLIINYEIGGVAIEGTDYNFLPDSIVFLPGQDSVTVNLLPIQDGINEPFESVTISVELINICGDTIVSEGIIYIGDGPILNITESDTTIVCANDSVSIFASASGGYAPYTYEWTDLDGNSIGSGDTITQGISENGSIDVIVTATDFCLFSGTDTVTLTLNQTLGIDTIYVGPATCEPDGFVSAIVVGDSVTPEHGVYYSWLNGAGQDGPTASVWTDLPSGWYYISVEDAVCTVEDSAFVELLDPPIAVLTANPLQGCAPLLVSFDYGDSQNADAYVLSFGNGTSQSSTVIEQMSQTYDGSGSNFYNVQLVVSQGANCADSTQLQILIDICGCTDPNALNFDPLATANDGSCIYPVPPEPIVSAPNVFTPNNDTDDTNELFELETENLQELQLIVFNRWGNIVFNETSVDPDNDNPAWNGEIDNSGKDAEEGVYFYKYIAVGLEDQFTDTPAPVIEGHGFLHLLRK
ncbi:MAG: gliding motility-associated C-terminal domain-containing protein, partial [Crocinitomicaceae bacterium]|nr:gliding motility-associated C-terminal domain-containing protein [Crocinitomicaceae bacterium]